jgi:carboxyl-terminal processing protease
VIDMKTARCRCLTLLLCLAAVPHQIVAEENPAGQAQLSLDELRTFTDVFQQLRENYIEEMDDATLLRAAIHGMVGELDAYSSFIDADEFRALEESAKGRKGGIGAAVMIQQRRLIVQSVLEEGPADQAGIAPGDIITAVDGQLVRGRKLASSIEALHGEPGSKLTLRVLSRGQGERELSLERSDLPVVSVSGEWLAPGFGLLRITHFHQGERPLQGLILDLRQNLGGVLQSAVAIADGFLDSGLIVNTHSRYPATRLEFQAREGQWVDNVPLAILVDGATASSSEVLAAALQDHQRAAVIGTRTLGKGSIQSILRLRSGAALRLTTAHYFTPSGRSLQDDGIEPNIIALKDDDPQALALDWLRSAAADRP